MKNAHVRDIRVIDMLVIKVGLFKALVPQHSLHCTLIRLWNLCFACYNVHVVVRKLTFKQVFLVHFSIKAIGFHRQGKRL